MFGIAAWGHGRYWKSVMLTVFNVDPTRTHSYDISAVKTKKYEMFTYKCQCRTHKMTKIRHNRVMRNTQRYFCNYCKTLLVFQG
jgi:SprT protein